MNEPEQLLLDESSIAVMKNWMSSQSDGTGSGAEAACSCGDSDSREINRLLIYKCPLRETPCSSKQKPVAQFGHNAVILPRCVHHA